MIFISNLQVFQNTKILLFAAKFTLTLSHGQASAERGFSINANIVKKICHLNLLLQKELLKVTC